MAQMDDLYAALKSADAAGDTVGAQKLAGYIKSLSPSGPSVADRAMADPTAGQSGFSNAVAGYGKAGVDLVRGIGQRVGEVIDKVAPAQQNLSGLITGQQPQPLSARLGLPQQSDIDESKRLDSALMATTGGKVGHIAGSVIDSLPAAFVPGANTVVGAGAVGAGLGLLQPTATGESVGKNALMGGALGVVGAGATKLVAAGANKLLASSAADSTANAGKTAAAQAAREAGYVLPPTEINPSMLNSTLEGLSGKIKTSQAASMKNQPVTNALAAKEIGAPADIPLSPNVLQGIRTEAGKAYQAVTKLPAMDAAGAELPASVPVRNFNDPLTLAPKSEVDPSELVKAWKQSNSDANAYFTAYGRDANPETLAKAKAAAGDAKKVDSFLDQKLTETGQGDLLDQLKAARVQIAKTYSVEKAMNPTTGDVSANVLANQLAKGKPLSGGLQTIAQAGQAFPKAMQNLPQNYNALSPLDFATAAMGGSMGHLAIPLVRPAVRGAILSDLGQRLATPSGTPNKLLQMLSSDNTAGALLGQARRSTSATVQRDRNP